MSLIDRFEATWGHTGPHGFTGTPVTLLRVDHVTYEPGEAAAWTIHLETIHHVTYEAADTRHMHIRM